MPTFNAKGGNERKLSNIASTNHQALTSDNNNARKMLQVLRILYTFHVACFADDRLSDLLETGCT